MFKNKGNMMTSFTSSQAPIVLTEEGRTRFEKEIAELHQRYLDLCEERTRAHALSGDGWHDNPYFNKLQQEEAKMSQTLALMREQLRTARVVSIDTQNRPTEQVRLGSIVKLRVEWTDQNRASEESVWEVVGYGESDPDQRRLAYTAPLIQAVIGAEEGEERSVQLKDDCVDIEVVRLYSDWSEL